MKFWIREVNVKVAGKEFTGDKFTIDFNIPFSAGEEPDISEVSITNLSNDSTSRISKNVPIIVSAGYKGNVGMILSGKVEKVSTVWNDVDKITTITVSDGAVEWRSAVIQQTYNKGSKASDIMSDLIAIMGLQSGGVNPKKDIVYQLGKTISGNVNTALKRLVKDTDSKMYINKGRVFIRPFGQGTSTNFLLSSDHGLIGSPEKVEDEDENGNTIVKYNVTCLLNHQITTDDVIRIESRTVSGNFRVESGEHTGDFKTNLVVV